MSTFTETAETRVIFKLQSELGEGTAFTDRTLSMPGQPSTETEARAAWVEQCGLFRTFVLSHRLIATGLYSDELIQPANWRDKSGSSLDTDSPYKTVDVEFELYTVQKQRFTAEDFNS